MSDRQWTGVVLAGGKSSRMGKDKALIELEGVNLLDRAIELLRPHVREVLVMGDPMKYASPHASVIADAEEGLGPVGGITTAMARARYGRLLVVACDMPVLSDRLMGLLKTGLDKGYDAAVPVHGDRVEPLAAAYHRHAIEPFQACLKERVLKMTDALARVRTHLVQVPVGSNGWPADLFRNLNTLSDL